MISRCILIPIRNVYICLHHNTNSAPTRFSATTRDANDILNNPDSYPVCNVTGHVHDGSASITFLRPVPRDDVALSPISLTTLDPPSFPLPSPSLINEIVTTAPPLDNSHSTLQTAESFRIIVTPPDPSLDDGLQGINTSAITTPRPTPETSKSAPPISCTTLRTALSLQHRADPLTPSDSLKFSPPLNPDLDVLSTGLSMSSHSSSLDLTSHCLPQNHNAR